MNKFAVMLTAVGIALSAPVAFAQAGNPPQQCAPGQKCTVQGQKPGAAQPQSKQQAQKPVQKQTQKAANTKAQTKQKGPKVGDRLSKSQPFQRQGKNSRFAAPPKGQEYRVSDDHLVLIDKNTLKVVSVLGLLSALTK